eukprot:Skav216789  [mRNA]  locus=scaffold1384:100784:108546:+ [translate_table: standard]
MTRKKRSRQPRQEAAKASLLHEQVQKARCLSEFVKLEFEAARAPFNEEALSPELLQLLQDVKLVEKHGEHFGILSFQLGRCELPWRELLVRVRRALSSETASQLVSTPKWQQLHSLLGDGIFCKIFQRYQVYLSVGGSRWLQLTGTMVTRKNQSEGLTVTKQWTPSEIIIKRPIFYSSRFPPRTGLLHGNALRMIIRQTGAGEAGARRFIWWLLGPQFHHLDKPPSVDMAPPRDPPKRKRQRGRRRKRSPASEAERAVKQRLEKPQATASMAGLQKEVIFEALMEPVLQMLNKTSTLKCQQLLGKCCPAKDALMTVKVFEKQNHQSQGGLPSIGALRCFCGQDSQRASRPHLRCTGGAAEIRFMREFPSLSCAVSSSQVARFICEVVAEVVGPEMLGRKNWPTLARHLRMLVKLRRFEELSVHDIMQNFSVKHFKDAMIGRCLARRARQADPCSPPHLGQLRDNRAMAEVSGRLCYFIFRNLAVPLLRDHFYATEAEPGGTQTMYFRKNVWQLLQSRADCGFLHSQCLELQRKPTRSNTLNLALGDALQLPTLCGSEACPPRLRREPWVMLPRTAQIEARRNGPSVGLGPWKKCPDNVMRVCRFTAWRFAWLLRRLPVVTPGFVARQVGRLVRYATRCAQAVRARGLERWWVPWDPGWGWAGFNGTPLNIKGMVRAAFRGALWPRRNTPLFKEALDELMPSRQPVVHKVGRVTGVTCDGEKAPEVLKLGRVTGVTGDGEKAPQVQKVGRVTAVTGDGEKAPQVLKVGRVTGSTFDGANAPHVQQVGRVTGVTFDGAKAPQVLKVGRVTGVTFDGANAPQAQKVGRVTGSTFDGAKASQVQKVGRVTGVTFDGANAPQAQKVGRVTGSTFDGAKASQVQKVGRVTGVTGDGANAPQVHKVGRIA